MALSAFDDKSAAPEEEALTRMLGRTAAHWAELIAHLAAEYTPLDEKWTFAGAKWGWSLRLRQKKRTVMSLVPCEKHFLACLALGDKAAEAARDRDLPDSILAIIDQAERFPEGLAVRIPIRNKKDREAVKKLAAIKMAN